MFEVPDDFVPASTQAHAQNLLMIDEAAKLLDMRIIDLVQECAAGRIKITARCNHLPCFSLQAIDAYRQRGVAQAS